MARFRRSRHRRCQRSSKEAIALSAGSTARSKRPRGYERGRFCSASIVPGCTAGKPGASREIRPSLGVSRESTVDARGFLSCARRANLPPSGEQRALRTGGNAIVLVDDLYPHAQPFAPGDADILPFFGTDEIRGQGIAEEIGDGHLGMTVLHGTSYLPNRVAGVHPHQECARGFTPSRPADKEAFASRGEVQKRTQEEARITLGGRDRCGARVLFDFQQIPATKDRDLPSEPLTSFYRVNRNLLVY